MELSHVKYVFIGPRAAVNGHLTSGYATAAVSTCTSCLQHISVVCVTVAIADKVKIA